MTALRQWLRRWTPGGRAPDPDEDPDVTRARADELAGTGRASEAISLLTELNHRRRDPSIERRLVELRFAAFEQAAVPPVPPWPDAVPDLFPGELVPAIDRAELSATTLRSGIANHGSLHVRRLLDPAVVAQLCDGIERSLQAYDAREAGEPRPDLAGWFEPSPDCPKVDRDWKRRAGATLAVDSPAALFDLVEVFDRNGISALARDYFGETPTLLGLKTTLRKVPHVAWRPGDWHQDGSFMGLGIRSLNVWIALTHCGDDAPGLDVIGRRLDYLAQTGTDGALADWSVGVAVAERQGTIVRPIFEPGDALLFDHLMLHRTALEPEMVNDRYAVEAWLFAPSTYAVMTSTDEQPNPPADQRPFWL